MIFHHPWALLTLLSLPLIVGLHFFRSRRRTVRIGGLHLWEFAPTRMPVGRRWQRLVRSLSLLTQLLAALLLSLMLAGMDWPHSSALPHQVVVLDSSLSMLAHADGGPSAARQAQRWLNSFMLEDRLYTVIQAGARSRVLAGPFATPAQVEASLKDWQPDEAACDLETAGELARKFTTGDERVVLLTDTPTSGGQSETSVFEIQAVGQPLVNRAIVYADRFRATPQADRVVASLRTFGAAEENALLQGWAGEQKIFEQSVALSPDASARVTFETGALESPLRLTLEPDALDEDNQVWLEPVAIQTVTVASVGWDSATSSLARAVRAVPYTHFTDQVPEAGLVFLRGRETELYAKAPHLCELLSDEPSSGSLVYAQGQDLLADRQSPLTRSLPLEGLIWPYDPSFALEQGELPLITHRGAPLLTVRAAGQGRARYRLNLADGRSNLFRQTAWPVLVQAMVEACRQDLPGLSRSNYRLGEQVTLSLSLPQGQRAMLLRGGQPWLDELSLPGVLDDLPAGQYEVMADGQSLARFNVNMFAPAESDLRPCAARDASLAQLVPSSARRDQTSRPLFFACAALLIILMGLSWKFQDTSA